MHTNANCKVSRIGFFWFFKKTSSRAAQPCNPSISSQELTSDDASNPRKRPDRARRNFFRNSIKAQAHYHSMSTHTPSSPFKHNNEPTITHTRTLLRGFNTTWWKRRKSGFRSWLPSLFPVSHCAAVRRLTSVPEKRRGRNDALAARPSSFPLQIATKSAQKWHSIQGNTWRHQREQNSQ